MPYTPSNMKRCLPSQINIKNVKVASVVYQTFLPFAMATFPERLQARGLFVFGVVITGGLCGHHVYKVPTPLSVKFIDSIDLYKF